jgi:hypothetical protein
MAWISDAGDSREPEGPEAEPSDLLDQPEPDAEEDAAREEALRPETD